MITLRFTWNVATDPAARSFTVVVPDLSAAQTTIESYAGDDRTFLVAAEDDQDGYRGSALVGGGRAVRMNMW